MKHKKLFVTLTVIISVVIFFAVFLMIWFFGDSYDDFESFRKEFEIPGLDDGAIPQGVTTCPALYYIERPETDKEGNVVTDEDGNTKMQTVSEVQQYFFVSAYMKDGSPSRIYVTGEKTGYVGYVTMKTEDGKDFYGHAGGIAINNSTGTISTTSSRYYTLWVTGDSMVYCAKSSDSFKDAKKTIAQEIVDKAGRSFDGVTDGEDIPEDYKSIRFTASFNANCNASFCFYYDDPSSSGLSSDRLYVGEFYREKNFKTEDSHKFTTPAGYFNNAVMYEYNVSSTTDYIYGLYPIDKTDGISDNDRVPKIQKIFSIPEEIQGVAFSGRSNYSSNDGMLIMSQSYGLSNSHLLCFDFNSVINSRKKYTDVTGESFVYEGVKKVFGDSKFDYTDPNLYIYYADKADEKMLLNDYSVPSMSEGMCVVSPITSNNGPVSRVYVLYESAGKKYKTFVRQQLKNVYSFIPKAKK